MLDGFFISTFSASRSIPDAYRQYRHNTPTALNRERTLDGQPMPYDADGYRHQPLYPGQPADHYKYDRNPGDKTVTLQGTAPSSTD